MGHPVYGASFSPEHLATLRQAFDLAWAELEPFTGSADKEATRDRLASIIITLGHQGVMQLELLKLCATRMLREERNARATAADPSAPRKQCRSS